MRPFSILLCLSLSLASCGQKSTIPELVSSTNFDSLTKVLEAVYESDQTPRMGLERITQQYGQDSKEMKAHWKIIRRVDSLNLLTVHSILMQYGWLSEKEVSELANEALWLVIQHSDLATQQNYLSLMEKAVKGGKAKAKHYGYLVDRILVRQGKFQIYGSQFQGGSSSNLRPYPIGNEPLVNQRRKEIGLDSLEVYALRLGCQYKVSQQDTYKDKVVVWGYIVEANQQRLKEVKILFKGRLLTTTNEFGEYFVVIAKSEKANRLQFVKEGYGPTVFSFAEEREVYEPVSVLNKL